jgi:hypothetical protein
VHPVQGAGGCVGARVCLAAACEERAVGSRWTTLSLTLSPSHHHTHSLSHSLPQVALPELDGAIEPIVFAGRDSATGKSHSLPDRVASLCTRAINWARLRKLKNKEKKVRACACAVGFVGRRVGASSSKGKKWARCAVLFHAAPCCAVLHCVALCCPTPLTAPLDLVPLPPLPLLCPQLAVTVFSFPPDKGNVGTAAYLDVFGSIYTVRALQWSR